MNDSRPNDEWARIRQEMVHRQIVRRGVEDHAVLEAMRAVPRHEFVPERFVGESYGDHPLPIGHDVTISQPYIVAIMTQLLAVKRGQRVLEIGTGSGYQAAVLAEMGLKVYSIEIIEPLGEAARDRLVRLGYDVEVRVGDGYAGWPEHAPFDAIILTAAPPQIPAPLVEQLAVGGRMVLPVGPRTRQDLVVLHKDDNGVWREFIEPVRFVPMTGQAEADAKSH
jgi:protein-L-isoaspartate(D-aspartate) O-methyltransferase